MTEKEYEEFKLLEEELDKKRDRVFNYERKVKRLHELDKTISRMKAGSNYSCLELAGNGYISCYIKDKEFCNKKVLEILENERNILISEIDEI